VNGEPVDRLDWNDYYRAGDIPWEKGSAAPPLIFWLQRHGPLTGDVLVPGCGFGHDVREIARMSSNARVVGLDIAPLALERARRFPQSGNESYFLGDLFSLPQEFAGRFDWVFEHTCFCAISPKQRSDYVRAIVAALRPSAQFLGIFYLDPWDPGEAPPEGGPPFGVSIIELNEFFLAEFDLVLEERPETSYPGREGREILWWLRKR
jgi:methyl halide transferase